MDSGFVDPISLVGSITQTDYRLKTGDVVTLTFVYDEDPELNKIESMAFGVPLTFVFSTRVIIGRPICNTRYCHCH